MENLQSFIENNILESKIDLKKCIRNIKNWCILHPEETKLISIITAKLSYKLLYDQYPEIEEVVSKQDAETIGIILADNISDQNKIDKIQNVINMENSNKKRYSYHEKRKVFEKNNGCFSLHSACFIAGSVWKRRWFRRF